MFRKSRSKLLATITAIVVLMALTSQAVTALQADNQPEVLFKIPLGEQGVNYEGVGIPESLVWGPKALTVAPDGSLWIADTASNRLLHFDGKGNLLQAVQLKDWVVGVGDLEVTHSDVFVLDVAAVTPKLVRFSLDGKMLASYEIPDDLGLKYGLTGIYAGDQGEILLEREGGVYTSQLVDANGTVNIVTINRYPHKAKLYSAHPANLLDADATRGYILIDQQMVDVTVNHDLGGLRILGFAPDDSFYVIVDEMQITPVIQVDQKVYHYSSTGELLGMARMPLVEQYTYVPHGLTVGPDGSVFALITRSDHAEVWRLTFTIGLDPILPSTLPVVRPKSNNNEPSMLLCTSRDGMIYIANEYINNSHYLNSANTDGSCSGRGKPSYIGGPGNYPSVSYDWGGFDSVYLFNYYMDPNTFQAGDINTSSSEPCSKGVDCSGFVSRAWELSARKSTCELYDVSTNLASKYDMLRGDIMTKCGVHVVLFFSFISNGMNGYESLKDYNHDRVVYIPSTWDRLNGYDPRRYNNVCP